MKLIKVRCEFGKKIEIEDTGNKTVSCPDYCAFKEKGRCRKVSFRYTVKLADSVKPDVPYRTAANPDATDKMPVIRPDAAPKNAVHAQPAPSNPFDDMFAAEEEVPPVNPYDDIFGAAEETPPVGTPRSGVHTAETAHSSSSANKYNSALENIDSLFYNVKSFSDSECCFRYGSKIFHIRSSGKYSSGNIDGAMEYIFSHWLVTEVFTTNGKYTANFLRILLAKGLKSMEKELKDIQDAAIDVNRKFFRLFYEVIFKSQINHFYFNIGNSKGAISPKFYSTDDFYIKLASASDPAEFLQKYSACFEELLYYLNPVCEKDERRTWFKENITLMLAEKNRTISYADDVGGRIVIYNLGSIYDFVSKMLLPAPLDELRKKVDFLEKYEITLNYRVIKRSRPLVKLTAAGTDDDSVYEISGIYRYNTAQCATAYNYYTTVVKEYIDKFIPKKITIGDFHITAEDFYGDLKEIISDACRHLNEKNLAEQKDVKIFYFVKSLVKRGVFAKYESDCETTKLELLKRTFFDNSLSLKDYFSFSDIDHLVKDNSGRYVSVDKYISDCIALGVTAFVSMAQNDAIIKSYFSARISMGDYVRRRNELVTAAEEYKKGIS